MSCFYKDSLFFSLYTNIYYHIIDNMKKFLIAEAEKARILGMHYNAMGKPMINEQAMVDFGGVFQALPFDQWRNTPEVQAEWKQGKFTTQELWNSAYNSYVIGLYYAATPFTQNDPSTIIGKTMIIWSNEPGALKPSSILKTFPVASVYCGNVYKTYGDDTVTNRNIYFFTQPQTVGDLVWDEDHTQAYDNKKANIVPRFASGPQLESPDLYMPDNNPILGLRVVRPNGTYYVFNAKTMQVFENGKTDLNGDLYINNFLYQAGQYAGLQMPQFNIEKPAVDTQKKRRQ
jgi:hypothetical protein